MIPLNQCHKAQVHLPPFSSGGSAVTQTKMCAWTEHVISPTVLEFPEGSI